MPEDAGHRDNTEPETISMEEYKKLQRRYDRRHKSATQAEQRVETLEASVHRVETMLEGLTRVVASGDSEVQKVVDEMIQRNKNQRSLDMTAAQLTASINARLDDADEDWDDPKFTEARALLDRVNASGDATNAPEVLRLVDDAINPRDTRTLSDQIAEAVAQALGQARGDASADTLARARVDNGSSSVRSGRISRADLRNIVVDPTRGIADLKSAFNAALDQITS